MVRAPLVAFLASLLLAACGSRTVAGSEPAEAEPPEAASAEPDGPPPPGRVRHLRLESVTVDPEAEMPKSRVTLIIADETGSTRREPIGELEGGCSDSTAQNLGTQMKPILALDCWFAGAGSQLRFVKRGHQLVVLRAPVDEMTGTGDYEVMKTIELPPGVPVTTDHDK